MLGAPGETLRNSLPWRDGMADEPRDALGTGRSFLTSPERAFVAAAADRLIPPDPTGPSASEAGVPTFIDRQLAGGFGQGDHFYLGGPWPKGTPSQGYQSRFTPAQFYRVAIADIERHVARVHDGKAFTHLEPDVQDGLLKQLEAGEIALDRVDAKEWFSTFLQNVREGYFADPIYGGNRDMAAWKMIGFPGAHYDYREWAMRHGEPAPYPPVGLAGRAGWRRS